MWNILHPFVVVVVLFSLTWRPTFGHLIRGTNIKQDHELVAANHGLPHKADGPSGLRDYSTDASYENVVSLSGSVQVLPSAQTSHSEKQGAQARISTEDLQNRRRKRNIDDNGQNLTTAPTETKTQIKQEEVTNSSIRSQDVLNTTEAAFLTVPTKGLRTDSWTTRGSLRMEDKKTTQETTPTSDSTGRYDAQPNKTDTDRNITSSSNLQTSQPTLNSTVQPDHMTHTPTSTKTFVTNFNRTESMKTTQMDENTDKWTNDSELKTSTAIKPVKTTSLKTTLKITTTRVVHSPENKQKNNPGPVVAAVIGTTLVLMFIVIIAILFRKRKIQKKQLENPEWAGPSPFLDGQPNLTSMVESESTNREGINQISMYKYLPQRLSKHLTPQKDDEEVFMGDVLQGTTFGRQNANDVQATNSGDLPKSEENKAFDFPASEDFKTPDITVENQEPRQQNKDLTAPSSQDAVTKPLTPLVSIDLDSLSEETAPSQTSEVENVPPAPPLP